MKLLILVFITLIGLTYFSDSILEVKRELPPPPTKHKSVIHRNIYHPQSVKKSKQQRGNKPTLVIEKIPKIIDKPPTLYEKVTDLTEVDQAIQFVKNFKFPYGEIYEDDPLPNGASMRELETKDGSKIYRLLGPKGTIEYESYISENLEVTRSVYTDGTLKTIVHANKSLDNYIFYIAVSFDNLGKVLHRTQMIDNLIFRQEYDSHKNRFHREVIDPETHDKVSFNYYFFELDN